MRLIHAGTSTSGSGTAHSLSVGHTVNQPTTFEDVDQKDFGRVGGDIVAAAVRFERPTDNADRHDVSKGGALTYRHG